MRAKCSLLRDSVLLHDPFWVDRKRPGLAVARRGRLRTPTFAWIVIFVEDDFALVALDLVLQLPILERLRKYIVSERTPAKSPDSVHNYMTGDSIIVQVADIIGCIGE